MNSPSENLNIVKQLYALFDEKKIDSILEMLSPDVVWCEPENPYNPAGGTRYGHQGFLEWAKIGHQAEEIIVLEPRKMLADHDTVAVIGYNKCKAIPTGKIFESDFVHVLTIKDGKITKFQEYIDTFAAGEAFRK